MPSPKQILVDFDATCVLNQYPFVGDDVDGCVDVLRKLVSAGHDIILYTMRCDHLIDDAINWFAVREIPLRHINSNPFFETGSRKIYGNIVIDDHNLGIPLIYDTEIHSKPFVDWAKVEVMLIENGIL